MPLFLGDTILPQAGLQGEKPGPGLRDTPSHKALSLRWTILTLQRLSDSQEKEML